MKRISEWHYDFFRRRKFQFSYSREAPFLLYTYLIIYREQILKCSFLVVSKYMMMSEGFTGMLSEH